MKKNYRAYAYINFDDSSFDIDYEAVAENNEKADPLEDEHVYIFNAENPENVPVIGRYIRVEYKNYKGVEITNRSRSFHTKNMTGVYENWYQGSQVYWTALNYGRDNIFISIDIDEEMIKLFRSDDPVIIKMGLVLLFKKNKEKVLFVKYCRKILNLN